MNRITFSSIFLAVSLTSSGSIAQDVSNIGQQISMLDITQHAGPVTQKRPMDKRHRIILARSSMNQKFQRWLEGAKERAQTAGIRASVIDQAFAGIEYDAAVIKRDRNQSEFTKTIWDYLDTAVSAARVNNGKAVFKKYAKPLKAIEAQYGVDKEIVAAIWGLESAYGGFMGSNNTIQSLASLAFDSRRSEFFEEQLMAALKILQMGEVSIGNLRGSWAGAMGHTQFMPSSYLEYAVDFNRDGRRDIWSGNPVDALASTAAYLVHFGWTSGQPWGAEVHLPKGFDYRLANRDITKSPSQWAKLGVHGVNGAIKDTGAASLLLPAGHQGAAFLIFDNFEVLEHYNTADAYVIGVGHLSDRLKGGPKIKSKWPRWDRALTFKERKELQRRLKRKGLYQDEIDARIGPNTVNAVRDFQGKIGVVQDGYASPELLSRLRKD